MPTTTVSERLEIRSSDDVVRVRQRVRACGRGHGPEPGGPDQDRHRGQRAGAQHARPRRRRPVDIDTVDGARKGVRLVFERRGQGHQGHRQPRCATATPPAAGSGSGWAAPSGCRTSSPSSRRRARARAFASRAGNDDHGRCPGRRREPGRGSAAAGSGTGRDRGLRRRAAGPARAGGDRAGHQPAQARRAAGASWWWSASTTGIDVLALDSGPGMDDVGACMADGYSTAGTPGNGLGAVRRQCEHVHVLSWRGAGHGRARPPGRPAATTRSARWCVADAGRGVLRRRLERARRRRRAHRAGGRRARPRPGGGHRRRRPRCASSSVAVPSRRRPSSRRCTRRCGPRGARAVAVARIDRASDTVSYAGVGNIAAALAGAGGGLRRLVSHNGTAGLNARRIQAFEYPGARNGLLVMHSDGISASWSLDRYPGLARAHPLLVAGVLYHHHSRGRDDARDRRDALHHVMSWTIATLPLKSEEDVVSARLRDAARGRAARLRQPAPDPPRHRRLGDRAQRVPAWRRRRAVVRARCAEPPEAVLGGRCQDHGPGIADVDAVLQGRRSGSAASGTGLPSAQRLVHQFDLHTAPGEGTRVTLSQRIASAPARLQREKLQAAVKLLPGARPDPLAVRARAEARADAEPGGPAASAKSETLRLRGELEETNRGVVALYAELDEKAEQLRAASELKSRFLSHMSHEFRTPLNSILALSRLLLDRVDGDFNAEQERQVEYIRRSAQALLEMVNDLLDLAKVEAGKLEVRPVRVHGRRAVRRAARRAQAAADQPRGGPGLRGRSRPAPDGAPTRPRSRRCCATSSRTRSNSPSRARCVVSAHYDAVHQRMHLRRSDTGIGIAPENHAHDLRGIHADRERPAAAAARAWACRCRAAPGRR